MPDYRSDKMESAEGRGLARARWDKFQAHIPNDVMEAAYGGGVNAAELPSEILDQLALRAVERAELIGSWVAWHTAGGFEKLVAAGWNRSTVFRKVPRFRAMFDAHPDECSFRWIKLDVSKAWMRDLDFALGREDEPASY